MTNSEPSWAPAPFDRRDLVAVSILLLASLVLYLRTVAPGVLDGDPGELQYIAYSLGIAHPTGFPLYVLLGKLWTFIPWGNVASRMNVFSGVLGSVTVALLYILTRTAVGERLPSFLAACALALSVTFWTYNTFAALYSLNTAMLCLILLVALVYARRRDRRMLLLAAGLWGLGLGNHPSLLALAPTFAALVFFADPNLLRRPRDLLLPSLVFIITLTSLYAYIPLRGQALLSSQQIAGQPLEYYTGMVTAFYRPSLQGFVDVVLARSFSQNVNLDWTNPRAVQEYGGFLIAEFRWVLILVPMGIVWLLVHRRWLAAAFLLGYPFAVILVMRYRSMHSQPYMLSASVPLCVFVAAGAASLAQMLRKRLSGRISTAALLAITAVFCITGVTANAKMVDQSSATAVKTAWDEILDSPLETHSGLMAHWGDLTPLWYNQQAEGRRTDLFGFFPPTEDMARTWLSEHALYLAGPLLDWGTGLPQEFRLVPWGRLVRVLSAGTTRAVYLPEETDRSVDFGGQMLLTGQYLQDTVDSGGAIRLGLHWRALTDLPTDYSISFRLVDAQGRWALQRDDRLVVHFYPLPAVPAGEDLWWVGHLVLPPRTKAGEYRVRAVVYRPSTGQELQLTGADTAGSVLEIGIVHVQ